MAENEAAGNQEFGHRLGYLRHNVQPVLTQKRVADELGLTEMSVRNWESSRNMPSVRNLQNLIEVLLAAKVFTPGHEQEEAQALWEMVYQGSSFDEDWFAGCLKRFQATDTPTPILPVVEELPPISISDSDAAEDMIAHPGGGHVEVPGANNIMQNPLEQVSSANTPAFPPFNGTFARNHDRRHMLERLHTIWIEGILEGSIQKKALIKLNFSEESDAVSHLWTISTSNSPQPLQIPAVSSDIMQLYDSAQGHLLILGEAGAGKTTLLLGFMNVLLRRAWQDESHPIPVLFNLSSWGIHGLPLEDWMVESLQTLYHVPLTTAQQWRKDHQILPLLDGLDEMELEQRAACIQAINKYREKSGLMPLVVCCRYAEYEEAFIKLRIDRAIMVQPLTWQQIEEYIKDMGGRKNLIDAVLHSDPTLQQLLSTPLMLNVFMQAYDEDTVEHLLAQEAPEELQRLLFAAYVRRMLQHGDEGSKRHYTTQQVEIWLGWLARELEKRNLSEFYIERMQLDWLPKSRFSAIYPGLVVGLMYGVFFGIIKGLNYAFMKGADQYQRPFTVPRGILDGIAIGFFNLCIFILINGIISWFVEKRTREEDAAYRPVDDKGSTIRMIEKSLVYGIPFGVLNGIIITLLVDLPAGVANGLFIWLIYAGLGRLKSEIQPAERRKWSWNVLRGKLPKLILYGLLVGIAYGLFTALYWQYKKFPTLIGLNILLPCLLFGLSIGVVIGLLIGLVQGLSHDQIDNKDLLKPNQGTWSSLRNSIQLGVVSGVLSGLFIGVIYGIVLQHIFQAFGISFSAYGPYFPKNGGLVLGIVDGLAVGAFFWIRSGGTVCLQHAFLRLLLWRAGCMPWHYANFLDAMYKRLLLRKIGGGYTFAHRLLRKYFAELNERDRTDNT